MHYINPIQYVCCGISFSVDVYFSVVLTVILDHIVVNNHEHCKPVSHQAFRGVDPERTKRQVPLKFGMEGH